MISSVKKVRSKNVSEAEKKILLELIHPKLNIIENIKTDGTTNKIKGNTWQSITDSYNALQTTGVRTTVQLKAMFDIMKRNSRKEKSTEKVNTYICQSNSTMTDRENEILVDLILTNKSSIDPTFDNQDEVWKAITHSYNGLQTSGMRTVDELKNCHNNLQKSAKLDINKEKSQTYKTGGGQVEHQASSISGKVMGMMGDRFLSLESPYDCDGDYPFVPPVNCEPFELSTNTDNDAASAIYVTVSPDDLDSQGNIESVMDIDDDSVKVTEMKTNLQTKSKNKMVASTTPCVKVLKKNAATPTRPTATKVYDSLENLTNRRLGTYTAKDKFLENYNNLKLSRAKIQLEIAEIEKNMLIEKLKADKEDNISKSKQNKLREEILEYELRQKKQGL